MKSFTPTEGILADIDDVLNRYRSRPLPVYAEAERIRRRWIDSNIALEDIIGQLMAKSAHYKAVLEFNPAEATDALMGTCIVDSVAGDKPDGHANETADGLAGSNIIRLRK